VQAALTRLPDEYRAAVVLCDVVGLSYEEIATVMGCSKGTVASRLNRGHGELARRLSHLRDHVV